MIEESLEEIGFSPSEIKVYLYLLRKGSGYANRISSETGINRTNVYEALDRLVSKGVTSFINKNKVKWFEAKSPNSLLSLIKEKEEEFKATKNDILEDIKTLNQAKSEKIQVVSGSYKMIIYKTCPVVNDFVFCFNINIFIDRNV